MSGRYVLSNLSQLPPPLAPDDVDAARSPVAARRTSGLKPPSSTYETAEGAPAARAGAAIHPAESAPPAPKLGTSGKQPSRLQAATIAVLRATLPSADETHIRNEPRADPRFASGRVVPQSVIWALYATTDRIPGALELLEDLLDPSDVAGVHQDAQVWPCPVGVLSGGSFVGRPYAELARWCLAEGAVPLGIYRDAASSGAPQPYAIASAPTDETELRHDDSVYVIASIEWAETAMPSFWYHSSPSKARFGVPDPDPLEPGLLDSDS